MNPITTSSAVSVLRRCPETVHHTGEIDMPRTKPQSGSAPPLSAAVANGPPVEVLNLTEAAAYLRLPAEDVLRMVREQALPARHVGTEWRFLKTAIQGWLSQPQPQQTGEGVWAFAGAWKDDPHVEEMLQEIHRRRGRSTAEEA
jgi:excisionase family DNA binding protein